MFSLIQSLQLSQACQQLFDQKLLNQFSKAANFDLGRLFSLNAMLMSILSLIHFRVVYINLKVKKYAKYVSKNRLETL